MPTSNSVWSRLRRGAKEAIKHLPVERRNNVMRLIAEARDMEPLILAERLWVPRYVFDDPAFWSKSQLGVERDPKDLLREQIHTRSERVTEFTAEGRSLATVQVEVRLFQTKLGRVGLSRGELDKLMDHFGHLPIVDNRARRSLPFDLKFISDLPTEEERAEAADARDPRHKKREPAELRPPQIAVVSKYLENPGGLIQSPTGSGKCVAEGTLVAARFYGADVILPIEDLVTAAQHNPEAGLLVFTDSGWEPLLETHVEGEETCLTLELANGLKLTAPGRHPVAVVDPDGSRRWARMDEVRLDDSVLCKPAMDAGFYLSRSAKVLRSEADLTDWTANQFMRGKGCVLVQTCDREFVVTEGRPAEEGPVPVVSIEQTQETHQLYDLTTASGTYVANGIVCHNTVMSVRVLCELNQTTLILVEEEQLARGWVDEFRRHTNIALLERRYGEDLIGIYNKTGKRGKFWPITVATYQSFIRDPGKHVLKERKHSFGTVWVDEVDRAAATCFSRVINSLNPMYRGGCSATMHRHDGLEGMVRQIVGPVKVAGEGKIMSADVHMVETGLELPERRGATWWTSSLTDLIGGPKASGSPYYFEVAKKLILKLIEDGRNVLLVCERNDFLKAMKQGLRPDLYPDLPECFWQDGFVEVMDARSNKDAIVESARDGVTRVVLGQAKILTRAIDVPAWDALILASPLAGWTKASKHLPMDQRQPNPSLTQVVGRVRRNKEGKRKPIIYDMIGGAARIRAMANPRRAVYQRLGFKLLDDISTVDLFDATADLGWM